MCSDPHIGSDACRGCKFQSLGRDSVCSDLGRTRRRRRLQHRFNPSVGILCVQTYLDGVQVEITGPFQSLGRDSVCSDCAWSGATHASTSSFNPSVGILCVQTSIAYTLPLPRRCFNPSVGILCVQTGCWCRGPGRPRRRFNPSVGILCVQTTTTATTPPAQSPFQSLGRDSVCSDADGRDAGVGARGVSIPRSGFCVFRPPALAIAGTAITLFQSLGRDSVCSDGCVEDRL